MKTSYVLALGLIAALALLFAFFTPYTASSAEATTVTTATTTIEYVQQPTLSPAQIIWFAHLMTCESGINPNAVLAVDRDGTPSIGILQFKQGTFDAAIKQYGLTGTIKDGITQVAIVTQWLLHPGTVDWSWQFPDCTKKYGLPPK